MFKIIYVLWELLKSAFLVVFDFVINDMSNPIKIETMFIILNGILIYIGLDYLMNAKESKKKKILKTLSVLIPWNVYFLLIANLILN